MCCDFEWAICKRRCTLKYGIGLIQHSEKKGTKTVPWGTIGTNSTLVSEGHSFFLNNHVYTNQDKIAYCQGTKLRTARQCPQGYCFGTLFSKWVHQVTEQELQHILTGLNYYLPTLTSSRENCLQHTDLHHCPYTCIALIKPYHSYSDQGILLLGGRPKVNIRIFDGYQTG